MSASVAILGAGWGARVQVPCFRAAGLPVAALWTRSPARAAALAADLDVPADTDYHRALASGADLVSVVSPPHLHAEMAVAALESGHHLLLDKPAALHGREVERMLASENGRWALMDHELRFLPSRRELRRRVAAGDVGAPRHLEAVYRGPFRLDPAGAWSWWSDRTLGGGALGAIGSHLLDALVAVADRPVAAVVAQERIGPRRRPDADGTLQEVTADDACDLLLRFAEGLTGSVRVSLLSAGPVEHGLTVEGDEGALWWRPDGLWGQRRGASEPELLVTDEQVAVPAGLAPREWERGTAALARALAEALLEGADGALGPAATLHDALHVQRIMDAARDSVSAGRWVDVAPRAEG